MHTPTKQSYTQSDQTLAGRLWAVAIVVVALTGIAATSAFGSSGSGILGGGASPRHTPRQISGASAFDLPPTKRCVSRGELTVQLRKLPRVKWISGTVKVNGRRFRTIERSQITRPVKLTGLPSGQFTLSITAKTSDGRRVTATATYQACVPKPPEPPKPPQPPSEPSQPGQPSQPSVGYSPPSPGSYSGGANINSYFYGLSFYVSTDGTQLQDVSIPSVALGCTPTKSFGDHLYIAEIAIGADGSFSATATDNGVISGAPAEFTYTFSGQFQGTKATGAFREDVTYDDGTSYSCTSNSHSWSATRDTQGTQTAAPPPSGSYSGGANINSYFYGLSFYVSTDGTQLEDVSIPSVALGCTPTKSFGDHLYIAEIAIDADGSFSATATEDGVISGAHAEFTYTFSGHFHHYNSSGKARMSGAFREDITYDDGTSYSCTSNSQSWSATRDTQGTQTAAPPPPGTYSGGATINSYFYGLSFDVSSDGTKLQNVSIPTVSQGCVPSKSFGDHLVISEIAIGADGSFSATTTENGVIFGAPAEFTYTFSGHFHHYNSAGKARMSGAFREDITYDNGTSYSCTSNSQSWSATH